MIPAESAPVLSRPNGLILTSNDDADLVDPENNQEAVTPQWVRDEHARHRRILTEITF